MIPIVIRQASADDVALVTSSWLESHREQGDNRWMSNAVYFAVHRPRMVGILDRASVAVACNPDDAWHIYGWLAHHGAVVHYAYTKHVFRRMGVFDRLHEYAGRPSVATHTGHLYPKLAKRYGFRFDPSEV